MSKIVTNSVAFPTYNQSIKEIGTYLGYKWTQEEVDAMESVALYFDFLETVDDKRLEKILEYNKNDCEAMVIIKNWIESQQ